jgi:16S rRNA processing protein RimM
MQRVKAESILIGKIAGAHGLTGNCRLHPFTENLDAFRPGERIQIKTPSGGNTLKYRIKWVKSHSRTFLISFQEVDSRDQAEALTGAEIYIQRHRLPQPEDGSFYWFDLIGLSVYTMDEEYLGTLESIFETGSNDVYVVKNKASETLIPAIDSVVREIDIEKKCMHVALPEGLPQG